MGIDESDFPTSDRCCRSAFRRGRWNWGSLTAVAIGVAVAFYAVRAQRADERPATPVEPPPAPPAAAAAAAPGGHVYQQKFVHWRNMDTTLTKWEAEGWEAFQIVPVANPTPGTGSEMWVAIVFRRPAKAGE
jgi:hypothetical protein